MSDKPFGPSNFGSSNPYNSPKPENALPPHLANQQKSGNGFKIFLWVTGILGGIGLLCVGCGVGMWFFSISMLNSLITSQFGDHPVVVEQIGELESSSLNFWDSVEEKEASGRHDNVFVFDVQGKNGSGQIIVAEQVGDRFDEATFVTDDGREFDLMRDGSEVFDEFKFE